MQRIQKIDSAVAPQKIKALFVVVKTHMGSVPNSISTMAQSPAALGGYLGFVAALAGGVLDPKLREQIAVAVAGSNACDYCASAHTLLGEKAGVAKEEIDRNLAGQSSNAKTQAALDFVVKIVRERGHLTDGDLAAVRAAGFSEEEIVEMIGHTALNVFTNYFNHVAHTDIDFPLIATTRAAA